MATPFEEAIEDGRRRLQAPALTTQIGEGIANTAFEYNRPRLEEEARGKFGDGVSASIPEGQAPVIPAPSSQDAESNPEPSQQPMTAKEASQLVTTGSRTTYESGDLSRKDAKEIYSGQEAAVRDAKGALAKEDESAYSDATAKVQGEYSKMAAVDAEALGVQEDELRATYEELDQRLADMRGELDSMGNIEPLKGFDRTSKALLVLSAALEGISSSAAGRPSNAAAIVNMAIDRDLDIQKQNMQRQLQRIGATERQLRTAADRWDVIADRKRSAAERAAAIEIASIGSRAKGAEQRKNAAITALKLDSDLLGRKEELLKASTGKTRTTKEEAPLGLLLAKNAASQAAQGSAPLPGKLEGADKTKLAGSRAFRAGLVQAVEELNKSFTGSAPKRLTDLALTAAGDLVGMNTEGSSALSLADALVTNYGFAKSGATVGVEERKSFIRQLPGPKDTPELRGKKAAGLLRTMSSEYHDTAQSMLRTGNILAAREYEIEARMLNQAADSLGGSKKREAAYNSGLMSKE